MFACAERMDVSVYRILASAPLPPLRPELFVAGPSPVNALQATGSGCCLSRSAMTVIAGRTRRQEGVA